MSNIVDNQVRFSDEKERMDFFNCSIFAHERLVRSICGEILESRDDVDDAVQETMLIAWAKMDSLRNRDAVKSWLCTIARHCALDMKERIQKNVSINCTNKTGTELEEMMVTSVPGPEEQLMRRCQREALKNAYLMLPDKYKLLLYLRFFLCLNSSEIEEIMGMESRSRINTCYRAKAALRANLSKLQS